MPSGDWQAFRSHQKASLSPSALRLIEEDLKRIPSKGWAAMIRKVNEVDLMVCPKCGGRMIRAGVDLVAVTELIGHADVKTTMIYCHSSAETKPEAVEKLSGIYAARKPQADAAPDRRLPIGYEADKINPSGIR